MKKVVHIIDSLGRGGAETLLVGIIKSMPHFEHAIISLKPLNEFFTDLQGIKVHCLEFQWYHSIPKTAFKVRAIIKECRADIVHANLFWSVIVARLAVPKGIKLINSYHAVLYGPEGANYPSYARLLDKVTYRKSIITLCVSGGVKNNIQKHVGIKKNIFVLYNYVEDVFFEQCRQHINLNLPLKLVAVGNLKKDKNYQVIIDAFSRLKDELKCAISLDVFGKGPLLESLSLSCKERGVENITFKGGIDNVASVLPMYDAFIISSTSEGFGLAVAEAMAAGLPVMVSDIPVLREVTGGNALFFNPNDPLSLVKVIESVLENPRQLLSIAKHGHETSLVFKKDMYLNRLTEFYL